MNAFAAHLLSLLCTSLGLVVNKFALTGLKTEDLGLINCFAALVSIFVHVRLRGVVDKSRSQGFGTWLPGLANALGLVFLMSALRELNPATVSMFNRLYLVFGVFFAIVLLKERCRLSQVGAIVFVAAGVGLFSFHPWSAGDSKSALAFAALAPLCFALCNTSLKHAGRRNPLRQLQKLTIASFVVLLALRFLSLGWTPPLLDVKSVVLASVGGILGSHLGLWLFTVGLRRSTLLESNVMRALSPLATALVSAPFFGLRWSAAESAGSALILCGMMLYSMSVKKSTAVPEGVVFKEEPAPEEFDSVLVLLNDAAKWVLARNAVRGGWEFPGGHREAGENYLATARREALEETGVTIRNIRYVGFYELKQQSNHRTIVVQAEVDEWKDIPKGFETSAREKFETLPEDLTFRDGLYAFLLGRLA